MFTNIVDFVTTYYPSLNILLTPIESPVSADSRLRERFGHRAQQIHEKANQYPGRVAFLPAEKALWPHPISKAAAVVSQDSGFVHVSNMIREPSQTLIFSSGDAAETWHAENQPFVSDMVQNVPIGFDKEERDEYQSNPNVEYSINRFAMNDLFFKLSRILERSHVATLADMPAVLGKTLTSVLFRDSTVSEQLFLFRDMLAEKMDLFHSQRLEATTENEKLIIGILGIMLSQSVKSYLKDLKEQEPLYFVSRDLNFFLKYAVVSRRPFRIKSFISNSFEELYDHVLHTSLGFEIFKESFTALDNSRDKHLLEFLFHRLPSFVHGTEINGLNGEPLDPEILESYQQRFIEFVQQSYFAESHRRLVDRLRKSNYRTCAELLETVHWLGDPFISIRTLPIEISGFTEMPTVYVAPISFIKELTAD